MWMDLISSDRQRRSRNGGGDRDLAAARIPVAMEVARVGALSDAGQTAITVEGVVNHEAGRDGELERDIRRLGRIAHYHTRRCERA